MKFYFSRTLLVSIIGLFSAITAYAQVPTLGEMSNFALFTTNGAVSNTGTSSIEGNVGANTGAISGFGLPTILIGTIESMNALTAQCVIDTQSAYDQLFATPQTVFGHAPAFGAGETVFPGVYAEAGAGSVSGLLTLDAMGDTNAVFIFKFGGAFNTGAGTNIILSNGAKSCNVFWISNGAIAMAASTQMKGTLIAGPGAVSMAVGGILEGRMLSTTGAIAVDQVVITPPCLTMMLVTINVQCIEDVPEPDTLAVVGVHTCDSVPPVVVFVSEESDSLTCPETILRIYSATDNCGNETMVTQLIIVNDTTNPTASNLTPLNVQCIGDVPVPDILLVIDEDDNCVVDLIVAWESDVSDGFSCPETITRTYSITDNCGNDTLVTQLIHVNDTISPTASDLASINVECVGDIPLSNIALILDESDNCTVDPVVAWISDVSDGLTCPETYTRTYSVTDDCGNDTVVTQLIIVNDITNPTASGLAPINLECIEDVPLVDITLILDEADNCTVDPLVAWVSDVSDGLSCPETIARTYSVTDDCGNEILLLQLLIVNDITNPTASGLAAINVTCTGDVPLADVSLILDEADNCTIDPVVAWVSDISDGLTCPETITRTYSVTDDCDNQILVIQMISVNDTISPTASGLADLNVDCIGDVPSVDISLIVDEADNCTADPVVAWVSDVYAGLTCSETITRTYSVTDDCGNEILITQLITVNDTINPTASGLAPLNVECIGDVPLADISLIADEADNCTIDPLVAWVSDISDGLDCAETITRTYSVTDDCGNEILITQLITVNDVTLPTASGLAPVNVVCMGDVPVVDITIILDEADNCTAAPIVAWVSDIFTGGTCSETITRTYSVTDDCGNEILIIQLINVNDTINPTASSLPAITVECMEDIPIADISLIIDEADNCTAAPIVAWVSDVYDGVSCSETITRTYSVTDDCGNEILIVQLITVNDTINPTASGLSPLNVVCIEDVPLPDVTLIIDEADNCSLSPIVAWVGDVSDGFTCSEIITRTYSVTDDCGNEIFITQLITVNDVINPTASDLAPLNVECIEDVPVADITHVIDEADNCTAAPLVAWVNDVSDGMSCSEVITRTYSVTDDCGNQILVTQLITINDITAPTASDLPPLSVVSAGDVPIQDILQVLDEADNCTAAPVVAWVSDISDDNVCNNELITRTYSVTDDCGNQTFVVRLITITAIYPTVNAGMDQTVCENDFITLNAVYTPASTIITWPFPILDGIPFPCLLAGTTSYTVSGDNYGCIATDEVDVTLIPTPIVSFSSNVNMGCEPLVVIYTNTSVSGMPLVSATWGVETGTIITGFGPISYTYEDDGLYDVTLTVTDANGCNNTLTIVDYIYVEPSPTANFKASNYSFANLAATSKVDFSNRSIGATSYVWSFGDGGTSTAEDPTHFFETINEGNYEITLIAYSPLGCTDTTHQFIEVKDELIYYIPNTFTPDGNSFNNYFLPIFTSGFDPYDYSLYIYNRWGTLLFESHNSDIGWDGTTLDGLAQDGTYVWVLEFKSNASAKKYKEFGHVNILR